MSGSCARRRVCVCVCLRARVRHAFDRTPQTDLEITHVPFSRADDKFCGYVTYSRAGVSGLPLLDKRSVGENPFGLLGRRATDKKKTSYVSSETAYSLSFESMLLHK